MDFTVKTLFLDGTFLDMVAGVCSFDFPMGSYTSSSAIYNYYIGYNDELIKLRQSHLSFGDVYN